MKNITNIFKTIITYISLFIKVILNIIKKIGKEISTTGKYISIGLFKTFDFLLTRIITFVSYVYYALVYICMFIYKYFLKFIFNEIYLLFKAIYKGFIRVVQISFYELPVFLVRSLSDFVDIIAKKFKNVTERISYFFTHTPNKIKDYFINKWNNLSIVKHYKNKKERELEVLLIDKFGKDAEKTDKKLTYEYLARNIEGKLVKGYFAALSRLDVHTYLLDNGFEVYEIKTNWWINLLHGESRYLDKQMNTKDLIYWLAQLSTYLKSGVPLTDAVKILATQDKRRKYKKIYDSIIYELSMGESFSEALKKQGNVFPALLINMIKAAELIGDLEGTLDNMSGYYEEKEETRKQMVSALTYPSVILIFALVVVAFMMIYLIPEFEKIYKSLGSEITGITKSLIGMSIFLKQNIITILLGIILILIIYRILYKKVKPFRTVMQYIYMHLPVVGNLIIYNEMTLFAKTFAVLNKNNILLTDSIDILSKITDNEFYKMIMYDTISNLLRGEKISLSFKDNWAVPPLAYYMITTGEGTGDLSSMLERVSDYYEREQRALANTLKTLVEPILMVVLAGIVGTVMISILGPMYNIGSEIITTAG